VPGLRTALILDDKLLMGCWLVWGWSPEVNAGDWSRRRLGGRLQRLQPIRPRIAAPNPGSALVEDVGSNSLVSSRWGGWLMVFLEFP
jgi:hypothetical protein